MPARNPYTITPSNRLTDAEARDLMQPRRTLTTPDARVTWYYGGRAVTALDQAPPVVAGGQGRGSSDVAAAALVLVAFCIVAGTVAVLFCLAVWCGAGGGR